MFLPLNFFEYHMFAPEYYYIKICKLQKVGLFAICCVHNYKWVFTHAMLIAHFLMWKKGKTKLKI